MRILTETIAILAAVAIHETGHIWAALAFKCHCKGFRLNWWGIGLIRATGTRGIGGLLIPLAGPMASAAAVVFFCYAGMFRAAFWNLGMFVTGSILDYIAARRRPSREAAAYLMECCK